MKVLIVHGGTQNNIAPFIVEQAESLNKLGIKTQYFAIEGKGILGYLKKLPSLKKHIKTFKPDLIHAHYGLSGLLANLQRKTPVITTYHGSDINFDKIRILSRIASLLSCQNIFVSKLLYEKMPVKKSNIIPCGIDLSLFYPMDKKEARKLLGLNNETKYILFSSSFDRPEKNYPLAKKIISKLKTQNVKLLEFKGYPREKVNLLYNAVDLALMTSLREGSPQFIKEALACNCPIVTNNVGDVKNIIKNTKNCFIVNSEEEFIDKIDFLLNIDYRTNGRDNIKNLELSIIAKQIENVYEKCLND